MQNVNLYQREQRRAEGPQPRQMQLGLVLILAVLAIHGAWLGWQLRSAGEVAVLAEHQARQAEAELEAEKADFREPVLDPALPGLLAGREAENSNLQRLVDHLKTLDAQRSSGFAALLQGLADRHPPQGLWLTHIRLHAGGSDVGLQGLTENQELVPLYLQSLGQSSAFSGRAFAQLDLQRDDQDVLRFRLSSRAVEASDE